MSFDTRYSRRKFLGQTLKSVGGLVFISDFPLKSRQTYLERSFFTMGTVVTISAYGESRQHVTHAIDKAAQEIQRIDRLMSLYKADSQLVQVNSEAGKRGVNVDKDVIKVVQEARRFHHLTRGSFDITVEPLMRLWGFRQEPPFLSIQPSDAEIRKTAEAVGFGHILIDEKHQTIGLDHPASQIDLGGIAVGFSVDLAVKALRSEGIESAIINHSGDAFALGKPEDDSGWRVGIPNPVNPEELVASFTLCNKAISTSGNYEKFVQLGSKRYGHIFDAPRGVPAEFSLSTTVITTTAIAADALSTGIFCTDISLGNEIICGSDTAQAYIVSREGKLTVLKRS